MTRWFPAHQYVQAQHYAITTARGLGQQRDVGLERLSEFGKPGYRAGFVLPKPENRQGFELRCEVYRASDPLPLIGVDP